MSQAILWLTAETKEKLRMEGVVAVYFFGSGATGNSGPFSDTDIGIVLDEIRARHVNIADIHPIIYDILSSDIPDTPGGVRLDISFLQKSNPALAMKAIRDGIILYESNATKRVDFEESIIHRYNDYLKLQREYEDATLQAFR